MPKTDGLVYVTAHVDNIKITGLKTKHFKQLIQQKFLVKEHNLARYLGLEIQRDRATRTISIAKPTYTAQIIKDFSHLAKDSNVLASRHIKGNLDEDIVPLSAEVYLYQQVIGKLMYLAC